MTDLKDVVFETDHYWVKRVPKGFEVYEIGLTHSTRVAVIGYTGDKGLERAKAEIARREAASGISSAKSPAQLQREIDEALARTGTPKRRAHATAATGGESSPTRGPSKEKLQQAAKWIRRELTKRADRSHPSHLASRVLEEADEKFQLGSFGVEGWAKSPSIGYQYLNYGDSYDPTIVVRSNPTRATVIVALGGWASYA
jgi:hypothetical protein